MMICRDHWKWELELSISAKQRFVLNCRYHKALKMVLRHRGNTVPWVVLGLVTSQFSTVKNGAVPVIKRGLTLGRFPGGELKNKRKAT